jgi:hypothetical protein
VTSLRPIPTPRSTRQAASSPHFCDKPIPKDASREKIAAIKIVPRRPQSSLTGSFALSTMPKNVGVLCPTYQKSKHKNTAIAIEGHALINPIIHPFLSQSPFASHSGPLSGIPIACPKVRFAPLLPVWSQPSIAAATEFKMIVE